MSENASGCLCPDLSKLLESPGEVHKLNGADYHTGEQVIALLNRAVGANRWDWQILDYGIEERADEVWVQGQLTARFCPEHAVVKVDFGAQSIKRSRKTGDPMSIGDDRKGAATDALKRCARLLGIGLGVWAKELPYRRPEDEPIGQSFEPRTSKQSGGNTDNAALARWRELLSDAERIGVPDIDKIKAWDVSVAGRANGATLTVASRRLADQIAEANNVAVEQDAF